MTADDHRIWRERLGAFVLGQLSDEERVATEAHLEGCSECRAEADSLSPMASMLERADPDRLSAAPSPPADLGDRIARRIAAERGRTRRRRLQFGFGLGAAVAAATAAILLAVSLTGGSTPTQPKSETVAFRGLPKGVSVDASLQPRAWGSNVSLHVEGFRPGTLCTVWLRRSDGTKVPAGSFRYVWSGESDEAQLSSGLDPPDVKSIGLRAGSRTFIAPIGSHTQS